MFSTWQETICTIYFFCKRFDPRIYSDYIEVNTVEGNPKWLLPTMYSPFQHILFSFSDTIGTANWHTDALLIS